MGTCQFGSTFAWSLDVAVRGELVISTLVWVIDDQQRGHGWCEGVFAKQ